MRVRLVSVEGNIGAGKSTFGRHVFPLVKERLERDGLITAIFVEEPLDYWKDATLSVRTDERIAGFVEPIDLLERFYADPRRWAMLFQFNAMTTRVSHVNRAIERVEGASDLLVFVERTIYTDRHIFKRAALDAGHIDPLENALYERLWEDWATRLYKAPLSHVVYFRADPELCLKHIQRRARSQEANIPLDYLEKLHGLHESLLLHTDSSWEGAKRIVLAVDRLGDISSDSRAQHRCADLIVDAFPPTTAFSTKDVFLFACVVTLLTFVFDAILQQKLVVFFQ